MITQDRLKELFEYLPGSGDMVRIKAVPGTRIGDKASYIAHNGYMKLTIDRKSYPVHRLAFLYMTGQYPESGVDVDHIDHNRANNKWSNIRLVSRQENMRNAKRSKANKSGYTGVGWCKQQSQWYASIMISGRHKKIGRFDSLIDAVAARIRANKLYGFHHNHGAQDA